MIMRHRTLLWQLFPSYLIIIILSIIAVTGVIVHSMKEFYLEQNARELEARAVLVRSHLFNLNFVNDAARIDSLCKQLGNQSATRITVILQSGDVIGDTDEDPTKMENHAHRPEVQEALAGRVGTATRFSHTLYETMMYVAIPVENNGQIVGVVRTAFAVTAIEHAFASIYTKILLGGALIVVLAALVSLYLSRRISAPLVRMKQAAVYFMKGDFAHRLPIGATEEIGELARTMNEMAAQLDDKVRMIVGQRNEREAILSSMVEGVVAFDNTERVISINRAAALMLDVNPQQITGKYVQESIRHIDIQRFAGKILETGMEQEDEIRIDADGPRVFQLHGAPLRDDKDQNLGAVIVLHDMTRLDRLETIRRDFVANVSHELRTPITSIKGFVETLRDGAIHRPDDATRFLDIIARQSDRLNSIINDLLALSELEQSGQRELRLERTPLRGLLEEAITVCESKARRRDVGLRLQCDEKLEAKANAPLLEQAIVNLIDNAIKYSEAKGSVDISGAVDGNRVVISVRDYGCGIEKMHWGRLFERFYRVDKARSRELGGTGLGLSIVKHIVLAHNGEIKVESTPGKGSTFFIYIPADKGESSV